MQKKIKVDSKTNSGSKINPIRGMLEIFFPKATGIAIIENDLYVSKVCNRAFHITHESTIIENFMLNNTAEMEINIVPFKRSLNEVVLSLPREKVLIREVDFPGTDLKELKEALQYQLDSFIPFTTEEVYYDVFTIGISDNNRKILIIAVKKDILDEIISKLYDIGIIPTKVIISPLAFIPIVTDKKGSVITVHKISNNYCCNTYSNGSLVSTLLANEQHEVLERINNILPDEIVEDHRMENSIKEYYTNSNFIGTMGNPNDNANEDLSEEPDEELDEEISEDSKPTEKSIRFCNFENNIESYGAALFGIKNDKQRFNLSKGKQRVINLQKTLIIGFSCILLLFLFLIPNVIIKRKLEALDIINREIKVLKDDIFRIEDTRNRVVIMEETLESVGKIQASYATRIKVLLELSEKIPKTAWIKELYIYRTIFEIGGTALAATDLIPILEDSDVFFNVGLTAPVVKTAEGEESFRIRGEINIEKTHEG